MSLLTNPEQIPRKTITFFLVVENSIAMQKNKLETVNVALENYISLLQYYAATKTNADVKIALLAFSAKALWITEKPVAVEQYVWTPISESINGNNAVCFVSMFDELNQKLAKNAFMDSLSGSLPPVIILFTTSSCPNNDTLNESLTRLSGNNWDKNALKIAFAIGKTAERELLERWTGNPHLTLAVKNPQTLLEYTNVIGRLCTQIAINSGVNNDGNCSVINRRNKLKTALQEILNIKNEPELVHYAYEEMDFSELFTTLSAIAIEYKNSISKEFVSLNPSHIDERIGGKKFFITRKYDGELAVLDWRGNSLSAYNSSGKQYRDLPCIRQAAKLLKKSTEKNILFAAELYCDETGGRSRVSDCASAIAKNPDMLRLAPFDIIRIDDKSCKNIQYSEIHKKLTGIFGENKYCKPVRYIEANSKAEIKNIYAEWVEKENSEGLIVRSELPIVYKLKPRVTVDAVVVGFSESSDVKGQVRTLLYALRKEDGRYQIIGRTGNGLTNEQKVQLFTRLSSMKVKSNYLEVDSNRLAFHMIRPELVIELSIGDVITEVISGNIKNPLLEYNDNVLKQSGICAGYSFISAVIERFREDKTNKIEHISLAQISEKTPLNTDIKTQGNEKMPQSSIMRRDVWTNGASVQKLLVWKTNKEQFGFPAYSASWTIFTPNAQEPFKVEMRISNSESQIKQLAAQFIAKNIKSGHTKEV
jgi:uncharacterized protein YegL